MGSCDWKPIPVGHFMYDNEVMVAPYRHSDIQIFGDLEHDTEYQAKRNASAYFIEQY